MKRLQGWPVAMLLISSVAQAEEWREIPYKDIARMQLVLEKVDTEHIFSSRYSVKRTDGKQALPSNLQIEIVAAGKTVPVRVDPEGNVQLPIRQDWADAGAKLRINQPKGALTLAYNYKVRTPAGTRMRYSQLTESLLVMERGIKQAAGFLSFMAPEPYALGIMFPPGPRQEVLLTFPDGSTKRFRTSSRSKIEGADNSIEVPWNPRWRDAEVTLSAPLGGVLPLMK